MRACARLVLVLIAVFASLGFAVCASIDELKDTMPDATDRRPPEKILGEEGKASNKKDRLGSKLQGPQTVELLKKSPVSVSTEAVRPRNQVSRDRTHKATLRCCQQISGPTSSPTSGARWFAVPSELAAVPCSICCRLTLILASGSWWQNG